MCNSTYKKHMSDPEIVDFIKNYIDKSIYNYAILINGGWGCGKTYFIENTLIPALKEDENYKDKKIIYISLYGITTKEELTRLISIESLPFNNIIKSKGFTAASSVGKVILSGVLSLKGVTLLDESFHISDFISLDNCILIFDDLERCDMNINEVLGYLNNFVEHDGIKIIIVANEKEISNTKRVINKELKYMVALNKDITFPKGENENKSQRSLFTTNSSTSDRKINTKELVKRVDTLFREDELYKQTKEKLIGVTIHYKSNINKIIDTIVQKNITDERIKKVILENKNFIIEQLDFNEHQNIRTLLFCFDKFNTVAESLINEIDFKELAEILDEILKYITVFSIHYKTGQKLPHWEEGKEIEMVSFSENVFNLSRYIKGFKFIDDLILGTSYDKERVIEVIKRYIDNWKIEMQNPEDPLYKLTNNWWLMEDHEAAYLIKMVNKTLSDERLKYNLYTYSKILSLNIIFNRIGIISVRVDDIVEKMKKNIGYFDVEYDSDTFGLRTSNFECEDDRELFSKCIKELNEYLKNYLEETSKESLKSILDNYDTWTDKLNSYVMENESKMLEQKSFLSKFEVKKLLEAIKYSSSEQIIQFRSTVPRGVYKFMNIKDYYAKDKLAIDKLTSELTNYLEEIQDSKKIKAYNLKLLIKDLEDVLKRLS